MTEVVKIKDSMFKDWLFGEFGKNVVGTVVGIGIRHKSKIKIVFLLENPLIETICKMWKSGELDENATKKLVELIKVILENRHKHYVTTKDIESLLDDHERLKIIVAKIVPEEELELIEDIVTEIKKLYSIIKSRSVK